MQAKYRRLLKERDGLMDAMADRVQFHPRILSNAASADQPGPLA
jgi:hypothetical protein